MDEEIRKLIEETVLEILTSSNLDEITEFQVRKAASEKLGLDLSESSRKKLVRQVVESYLQNLQDEKEKKGDQIEKAGEEEEEEEEEAEEDNPRKKGEKVYDDEGGLIVCRLSKTRKVTVSEFKGKTLVSIREFYNKDGKECPSSKGISLTAEQWVAFRKFVPAIENAIRKLQSN